MMSPTKEPRGKVNWRRGIRRIWLVYAVVMLLFAVEEVLHENTRQLDAIYNDCLGYSSASPCLDLARSEQPTVLIGVLVSTAIGYLLLIFGLPVGGWAALKASQWIGKGFTGVDLGDQQMGTSERLRSLAPWMAPSCRAGSDHEDNSSPNLP